MFWKRKALSGIIGAFVVVFLAIAIMPKPANAFWIFHFSIKIHSYFRVHWWPCFRINIVDKIVIRIDPKEGDGKQNAAIVAIHVPDGWAMTDTLENGDPVGPHAYYDTLYGATLGWSNAIPLAYSEAWSDSLELLHPKQDYTWYAFEDTAGKMADPDYCPVNDSVEVRWTVYEEAGACTPPEADLNFYCGYTDGASISVTDSAFDEYEDCWGPLSVEMSSISATGHDSYVEVEWITASEIDNAGFNLYHSISKEGEKSQLNEALIPAQGDELQGASYSFTDEDVTNGVTYYYWLEDVDLHGRSSMHGPVSAIPTSVEERKEMPIPAVFSLAQNYPNPFNATTLIRYALPAVSGQQSAVSLKIYNIAGQEVRTLVDEEQAPGYYSVSWDGRDGLGKEVSSGIYFYRLKAGSYTEIRKMVLLK